MTVVAIFTQKYNLASHKWKGFADLRDFSSDLLNAFLGLIFLIGQFLEFLFVFVLFSGNVSGADTESVFLIFVELLIKLYFGVSILLDFFFIWQILCLISLELADQFTFFFGQVLHFLGFGGNEFVKSIDLAKTFD